MNSKSKMKLRMKSWYWGNYITEGQVMNTIRVTKNTPGFEEYIESKHGWHHSEEFKTGYKLKPYSKESL